MYFKFTEIYIFPHYKNFNTGKSHSDPLWELPLSVWCIFIRIFYCLYQCLHKYKYENITQYMFYLSIFYISVRKSIMSIVLQHIFESLFGGSSRGAQLLVYPWPKTGPPLSGMVVLFDRAHRFGRDAHGAVREEGDTCLASQISRINPGDQWGDRCRNQIALTSYSTFFKEKQAMSSIHVCIALLIFHLNCNVAYTTTPLLI